MNLDCPAVQFWLARKCYFRKKLKQQGRFAAIWEAKFCWAIYRMNLQLELEARADE
jgi:hypothetical protein